MGGRDLRTGDPPRKPSSRLWVQPALRSPSWLPLGALGARLTSVRSTWCRPHPHSRPVLQAAAGGRPRAPISGAPLLSTAPWAPSAPKAKGPTAHRPRLRPHLNRTSQYHTPPRRRLVRPPLSPGGEALKAVPVAGCTLQSGFAEALGPGRPGRSSGAPRPGAGAGRPTPRAELRRVSSCRPS